MRGINEIYEFNQTNTHTKKKNQKQTNRSLLYKVTGTLYFMDPFMIVNCTGYKKCVTFFNVVG